MFAVAGGHTPDRVLEVGEVFEGFQHHRIAAYLGDAGVQAGLARRLVIHKLVDVQVGHDRTAEAVEGVATALPAFHFFGVFEPKVFGERDAARIQQIAVF